MSSIGMMHVSPVLLKGALGGCWAIGAFAAWSLVVQFDRDLKPMILAMMLAGGLERPVAWTEMAYLNIGILIRIACWYPLYFVRLTYYCVRTTKPIRVLTKSCRGTFSCCCRRSKEKDDEPEADDNRYYKQYECVDGQEVTAQLSSKRSVIFVRTKSEAGDYDSLRDEKDEPKHWLVGKAPHWIQDKISADLRRPWNEQSAGKRMGPRILGLTTVLLTLSYGIMQTITLLQMSTASFFSVEAAQARINATDDLIQFIEPIIMALEGKNNTSQREEFLHMTNVSSHFVDLARNVVNEHEQVVTTVLSIGVTTAYQLVMFILYSFMWLLQPMTSQLQLYKIVNTYFKLKTYCSVLYATFTYAVLMVASVDVRLPISMVSFFLNFIPEVGAIVSLLLPLPILLFDGRHLPNEQYMVRACGNATATNSSVHEQYESCLVSTRVAYRVFRMFGVLVGLFVVKLLVGNGLESWLMGTDPVLAGRDTTRRDVDRGGGKEVQEAEELHPVIVLSVVVLGGAVWGPVGMLVSVPLISVTRLVMNDFKEEPDSLRQPSLGTSSSSASA